MATQKRWEASSWVMVLLKLAGLPVRDVQGNPFKAPKRLLPFIEDDGAVVADSTLIRFHLEKKYDAAADGDGRAG